MALNVLEAVRAEAPDATLVAVASGEVYGTPERLPVDETAPLRPQNPYAVSKAATDLLAGMYADAHGLRVIRARAFNHAGPGQEPTYAIASFARQAAQGAQRIVTGNPDTRRDYTDVRDVVRAYRLLAERADPGVYNVCSGRTASHVRARAHARRRARGRPRAPAPARGDGAARLLRQAARGDGLGARDRARGHAARHRQVVARRASTGPNCCATTRARSISALVNACGCSR